MELAEDKPRLREALTDVVDRVPHPLLPPSELLGRERDGERPPSLVILQTEESLEEKRGQNREERRGEGTHEIPHPAMQLYNVNLVRPSQLFDRRHDQLINPVLDPSRRMPISMIRRIKLVQSVHPVVKPIHKPHRHPTPVGVRQLAFVHQPSLIPPVKLGSMTASEVGGIRTGRVETDVVVVRDGDVATEELAKVDETVAVDGIANYEDGGRVSSPFAKEGDGVFGSGRRRGSGGF
jgi:hypothetical protein